MTGSYVGTGANSWTLNFGVVPKLVLIVQNNNSMSMFSVLAYGQNKAGMADGTNDDYGANLTWSGTSLIFTAANSGYPSSFQYSGRTYLYVALY